jgi:hypothetical protein
MKKGTRKRRYEITLPYNRDKVREDIAGITDLTHLRQAIQRDISETYQTEIEDGNANQTAGWCGENQVRLVCGRFSRAFYLDALLLASSQLYPSDSLRTFNGKLEKAIEDPAETFHTEKYFGSEIQKLTNLTSNDFVSSAEIEGRITELRKAVKEFENDVVGKLEKKYSTDKIHFQSLLSKVRKISDAVRSALFDMEVFLKKAPGKEPVFIVFFQRLTETGAINVGLLNELKDPFFSEDIALQSLLEKAGHNFYITPQMKSWLRKCDDWVEALPAYASYTLVPKEGGGYQVAVVVQRSALEEMYRRYADDWAENINEVMELEHVALAREMIVSSKSKVQSPKSKSTIRKNPGSATFEDEVRIIRERQLEKPVAELAALIGKVAEDKAEEIARLQEKGYTRFEALRQIFSVGKTRKKNTPTQIKKYHLEEKSTSLEKLVYKRRRALPCIHVLTTLGPGETEINVETWLEESMALYNICKAYNLSSEVEKKMEQSQERIISVGKEVVKKLELEGTLYQILEEVSHEKNSKNIDKGIAKLIASYPEVVTEVAKVLNITRQKVYSQLDKTLAVFYARREVVGERGLSKELYSPRFRYESTGAFKRYHLLYTPSRVDLGAEEIHSVKCIPKWLGGRDNEACLRGKELYAYYNTSPQTVKSPRLAEFMKVGENFFTRGGVYYLSLAAGANIDTLGMGDFEYFRNQWNLRGDRIVLPTGETYGGFCVPKEFTLLYATILLAVNPDTSGEILNSFGIPVSLHSKIIADLRKLLRSKNESESQMNFENKACEFLTEHYKDYFSKGENSVYIPSLSKLANLFVKAGLVQKEDSIKSATLPLTNWINKKALGLEEINRVGPFRKIQLILSLIQRARSHNPSVVPVQQLVGVMGASYKEGSIKEGRLIPITDVRFSAGARKLEIYAGMYEQHLLKDVDTEGREIIRTLFRDFKTVGDIRMVGTCTGSDVLNYIPNSGLEKIKEEVNDKLLDAGLSQTMIRANCMVYGGELDKWVGITDLPEDRKSKISQDIGPKIHLVVIDQRGPQRTYEEAVQGVDFVDLGIPDPELLDLIDNLPKLIYLMKRGRENSALVLADGTSGARRRTFSYRYASSKRKVKELFALDDNACYGSLGLGQDTIEEWRQQMLVERDFAQKLYSAVVSKNYQLADELLQQINRYVILNELAEEAADDEKKAKEFGVWSQDYRYASKVFGTLKQGISVNELDFGIWILLGGIYVLNGKYDIPAILRMKKNFEISLGKKRKLFLNKTEIEYLFSSFIKPIYNPVVTEEYAEVQTGMAGSLKAVEEKVSRLEKLQERRRVTKQIIGLQKRKLSFDSTEQEINKSTSKRDFKQFYKLAKDAVPPGNPVSQDSVGKFIAYTKQTFLALLSDTENNELLNTEIQNLFNGGTMTVEQYRSFAKLFAKQSERFDSKEIKEKIADTLELLDIYLLLDMTMNAGMEQELMIEIARFFDITLNNHIFDYIPYHYHIEHGIGYKDYSRQELFELSSAHHQWLYSQIHYLLTKCTPLKNFSKDYLDSWLGDYQKQIMPTGINLENRTEQFWFNYARLRDAVVLHHEGFPYPVVIKELSPSAIKASERVNVAIIYPFGNTTVPVALETGIKLAEEDNVNLMLTAFPKIHKSGSQDTLQIYDGLTYLSPEIIANISNDKNAEVLFPPSESVTQQKVFALVQFDRPITAHGIFFHFTHYLRPKIDFLNLPVIQPLVWEAATHLKCRLPDMLKGSGVTTPDQFNWLHSNTEEQSESKAKKGIQIIVERFSTKHENLIVKSEKESGGRSAKILQVRKGNRLIKDNIETLTNHIYEISKSDNVVIQQVLKSSVRRLYTPEFLEDIAQRFIKMGVPVLLHRGPQTPLFSYFREILVLGKTGYKISHHITVLSTQGIANVGQGGILYEYRDEIIHPKYRQDLRREMTKACMNSIKSQSKYIKAHAKDILNEYLAAHGEFKETIDIEKESIHCEIPYEMGDYMPVFLVNEKDQLTHIFDSEKEEIVPLFDKNNRPNGIKIYDAKKKILTPPYSMFDENDKPLVRFDKKGHRLTTLIVYKIESNPGAGLWRPFNDQLPIERKGDGLYTLFKSLGERARDYKTKAGYED